jgi:hypothetical protein
MKLRHIIETTTTPDAPTKPGTPTVPVERPAKPKPDFKPFNPPRPKEDPGPKAEKEEITEAFEDEANPKVVEFWRNIRKSKHPYSKHPIMAMYGHESAQKAFEHSVDRAKKSFPSLRRLSLSNIGPGVAQIMYTLMRIEKRYKNQLEEIAKDVVSKVWGVPRDILDADITSNVSMKTPEEEDENEEDVDVGEINKRITLNALTQGAAVHNMMTMHKLVEKELNDLDPQLLQAYDQLSSGSEYTYWLMDYSTLAGLTNYAIGTANVQYDADNQPMVVAKARVFPVLIQELVKGVMELLSHHGLSNMSKGQLKRIYRVADNPTDEPWLIQVGPHLWRSFLKIVPDNSRLAETVARLASKDPKYVHDLLSRTIEAIHADSDVSNIKDELRKLIDEVEDYEEQDI